MFPREADIKNVSASKIRQATEEEMRKGEEGSGWQRVAVTRTLTTPLTSTPPVEMRVSSCS
jgi:hypothetical protein